MDSPPRNGDDAGLTSRTFDVPMGDESVVVELDGLNEDADYRDPIDLILENKPPDLRHFVLVVEEAWRKDKWRLAISFLEEALDSESAHLYAQAFSRLGLGMESSATNRIGGRGNAPGARLGQLGDHGRSRRSTPLALGRAALERRQTDGG